MAKPPVSRAVSRWWNPEEAPSAVTRTRAHRGPAGGSPSTVEVEHSTSSPEPADELELPIHAVYECRESPPRSTRTLLRDHQPAESNVNSTVHVFVGTFDSLESARAYTEEQWEPEPVGDVSDEEYAAWEARNPAWAMRGDLDAHLDSDFIETIDGQDRFKYLGAMLTQEGARATIEERAPSGANVLVLVFREALGGFPSRMASTKALIYCGEFPCSL